MEAQDTCGLQEDVPRMQPRHPDSDSGLADREGPSSSMLLPLIDALRPADEAALAAAMRVLSAVPGVCAATVEVYPERAGRPSIVAGEGPGSWPHAESDVLRIDLVDHERVIGVLTVVADEGEFVAADLPRWCETAAVLISGVAARLRLEAILLDAQSYEVAGQIAAGLVHDFNNMLTGIMGNASIAQSMIDADDRAAIPLQRIAESASSAAYLSRALLNFVRGSNRREPLALNEMVTGVRGVMSRAIREGVVVHLDLAPDVPVIVGERSLIQQALVNLMMNAADAIDGDGSITIRTRRTSSVPPGAAGESAREGRYVALSVEDTGPGIAPEHLVEIFRPFFSTKGRGGTGLGLPSVAQVACRHGGAVRVEGRLGLGARFTIYLPEADDEPAAQSAAQPARSAATVARPGGRRLRQTV